MDELHFIQMQILRELLFKPKSKFSELNNTGLDNDHFSYHLNKLVELQLVIKINNQYSLTTDGKKYAGSIDTQTSTIEKQPKSCVLLIATQGEHESKQILVQQRLKEPYYGYWGFISGKIKYGETIYETAQRELYEETGLTGTFTYQYTLHDMVYSKEHKQLEDKFFYVIEASNLHGTLLQTNEGNNKWVNLAEFKNLSPKYYDEDDVLSWYINKDSSFKEHKYYIDEF